MRLIIAFLLICNVSFSQLSDKSEISIITIGPGINLYEKFGHTAIRVKDDIKNFDYIYNYGIFDFRQSNFYWNFTKGYMKYQLRRYSFYSTLTMADAERRWLKEQVLNLNAKEKNKLFKLLETNALPQNASYLYDPFKNNCSTKPRDLILKTLGDKFVLNDSFSSGLSYRDLMNEKINQNTWGSFGINLALGAKLDQKLDALSYAYLPEYLFKILEKSKKSNAKIVKKTNLILDFKPIKSKSDSYSPFGVFGLLTILILWISYRNFKTNKRTKIVDFILLFSSGITGCILLFLWFFTVHSMTPYNFNVLWAFAPNLVVSFFVFDEKLKPWVLKYINMLIIFIIALCVIWLLRIQTFNWNIILIIIPLLVRYLLIKIMGSENS